MARKKVDASKRFRTDTFRFRSLEILYADPDRDPCFPYDAISKSAAHLILKKTSLPVWVCEFQIFGHPCLSGRAPIYTLSWHHARKIAMRIESWYSVSGYTAIVRIRRCRSGKVPYTSHVNYIPQQYRIKEAA